MCPLTLVELRVTQPCGPSVIMPSRLPHIHAGKHDTLARGVLHMLLLVSPPAMRDALASVCLSLQLYIVMNAQAHPHQRANFSFHRLRYSSIFCERFDDEIDDSESVSVWSTPWAPSPSMASCCLASPRCLRSDRFAPTASAQVRRDDGGGLTPRDR